MTTGNRWHRVSAVGVGGARARPEIRHAAGDPRAVGPHGRARRRRSPEFERRIEAYLDATGRFPRRAPGNCLERSLGAYRLLCAANASPTLVVGLRQSDTLGVEGHVWVVVDGRPLAERPGLVTTYHPNPHLRSRRSPALVERAGAPRWLASGSRESLPDSPGSAGNPREHARGPRAQPLRPAALVCCYLRGHR